MTKGSAHHLRRLLPEERPRHCSRNWVTSYRGEWITCGAPSSGCRKPLHPQVLALSLGEEQVVLHLLVEPAFRGRIEGDR